MTHVYDSLLLDDSLLQEEVMAVMQMVSDVNAMSSVLRPGKVHFSTVLVSPEARGLPSTPILTRRTEVSTAIITDDDIRLLCTKIGSCR